MTTLTWTVGEVEGAKMKALALILADPNPIHFDPAAASGLGTGGRLVNQGPSTIAMIYNLFAAELPGQRVRSLDVRLLGNVLEGDSVTVEATPAGPSTYEVVVRTPDGPKATAVAHLAERA
jgi:acyl dehydratase